MCTGVQAAARDDFFCLDKGDDFSDDDGVADDGMGIPYLYTPKKFKIHIKSKEEADAAAGQTPGAAAAATATPDLKEAAQKLKLGGLTLSPPGKSGFGSKLKQQDSK